MGSGILSQIYLTPKVEGHTCWTLLRPHSAGSDRQEYVFLPIPPRWWLHFNKVFWCFSPTKWSTWAFGVPKKLSEDPQSQMMFKNNTKILSAFSPSSHLHWGYKINCGHNCWPFRTNWGSDVPLSLPSSTPHTHRKKGGFLRIFMMEEWVLLLLLKSQSLSIHMLNISCDKMRSTHKTLAAYQILKAKHSCDCWSCELN